MRKGIFIFMAVLLVITATVASGKARSKPSEQPNKNYSNVNVALYMTVW